jgi:membrane fusion protein (multidrug efflux system)
LDVQRSLVRQTEATVRATTDPARVTVDAFPDLVLSGHVEKAGLRAPAAFALLPPDGACMLPAMNNLLKP